MNAPRSSAADLHTPHTGVPPTDGPVCAAVVEAWLADAGFSIQDVTRGRQWTAYRVARLGRIHDRLARTLTTPARLAEWWDIPVRVYGDETPRRMLARGAIGSLWVAVRQVETAQRLQGAPRPRARQGQHWQLQPPPFGWTDEDLLGLHADVVREARQSVALVRAWAETPAPGWTRDVADSLEFWERQIADALAELRAGLPRIDRAQLSPFLSHPDAEVRRITVGAIAGMHQRGQVHA